MAGDVEKGAARSAKDLQDVFAKAEHAVTKHHYLRAPDEVGKAIEYLGREIDNLGKTLTGL